MLYKVFLYVAIFLCGTPLSVRAQEVVPFLVETLRNSTVPTTVRTGEPFTVVYKISYVVSESWGKEVIIFEDKMRPSIFPSLIGNEETGNFEIIGWVMDKPVIDSGDETDEYTRYLRVTLRIISPKKAAEYAKLLGYSKKQFVRLCLQDIIDRDHLGLIVNIEDAA